MESLNEVAKKYLKQNGITNKKFAEYIECDYTKCHRWLSGERKINSEQIRKVHDFLSGDFLKSVEDIMKEE